MTEPATYREALYLAQEAGAPNPRACAENWLLANESVRKAHEVQQARIDQWRAQQIVYPRHPTVCPKR